MMRRKDREVKEFKEICAIADRCKVCRVALIHEGKPYLLPLNFGWAEENGKFVLYLHSALEGTKIEAAKADPNICFEMDTDGALVTDEIPCRNGYLYSSVIGSGQVEFIETLEARKAALNVIMRHQTGKEFTFSDNAVKFVALWRVEAQTLTGKQRVK